MDGNAISEASESMKTFLKTAVSILSSLKKSLVLTLLWYLTDLNVRILYTDNFISVEKASATASGE